ncbi:MAG: hypothetical protein CM1200mP35_09880 [Chloroflexota bacterium]|nr:MAG: hypothetical protein CM1200mP35_09880 [Chloroflexota bacterium]
MSRANWHSTNQSTSRPHGNEIEKGIERCTGENGGNWSRLWKFPQRFTSYYRIVIATGSMHFGTRRYKKGYSPTCNDKHQKRVTELWRDLMGKNAFLVSATHSEKEIDSTLGGFEQALRSVREEGLI